MINKYILCLSKILNKCKQVVLKCSEKGFRNNTIIVLHQLIIRQTSYRLSLYLFLKAMVDRGFLVTKNAKVGH